MKPARVTWATCLLAIGLAACSGTSATSSASATLTLPLGDVPAAVAQVRAKTPDAKFTEINVSPEGVSLFVVTSPTTEHTLLFQKGTLGPASADQPIGAKPYSIDGVPLDQAAKVAAFVSKQFNGATVTTVALLDVNPFGLVWAVRSRSSRGGMLNSMFSPDGKLLSTADAGS